MEENREILLSFCIPTYNRREFVVNSVKAIQSLNRKDIEIIVSNNCSLDDTEEKVLELAKDDLRIKYYKNEKNIGQAKNIITCFKRAKGKYVYLTSDEDEMNLEFFSDEFINELKEERYSLVVGSIFNKNTKKYYIKEKEEKSLFLKYHNVAFRFYLSGIIFKRNCLDLDKAFNYTNDVGSDYAYIPLILMCIKAGKLKKRKDIICYKNQDKVQYTDNELKGIKSFYYQPLERLKQLKFYLKCIEELEFNEEFKELFYKILSHNYAVMYVINDVFNSYKEEVNVFYDEVIKIPQIGKRFQQNIIKIKIKEIIKKIIPKKIIEYIKNTN